MSSSCSDRSRISQKEMGRLATGQIVGQASLNVGILSRNQTVATNRTLYWSEVLADIQSPSSSIKLWLRSGAELKANGWGHFILIDRGVVPIKSSRLLVTMLASAPVISWNWMREGPLETNCTWQLRGFQPLPSGMFREAAVMMVVAPGETQPFAL